MAHIAAFLSTSTASCFVGQLRLSSPFIRLKVTPVTPRLCTRVIRCHVEDWSPKELHQFRKKEAQKKLRKIRKERKAQSRAEKLAQRPLVKPNPAMLKFERPLLNWNKPWKKKMLSGATNHDGEPQGLGRKQGEVWVRDAKVGEFSTRMKVDLEQPKSLWKQFDIIYEEKMKNAADGSVGSGERFQQFDIIYEEKMKKAADGSVGSGERFQTLSTEAVAAVQHFSNDRVNNNRSVESENSVETPQLSETRARIWSRSSPSVDGKQSVLTRLYPQETEVSKIGDDRDTLGNDRFVRDSRSQFEKCSQSADFISEERMAGKVSSARNVPRIVIGQRKGEDVYLSIADDDATVKKAIPRGDLDEDKQLEWLAKQLDSVARPDGVHLSRLIRSGGLKITDGRSIILVQKLGDRGNWRCALQVVNWLGRRKQFPAVRVRYLYTTLLAVLGKARRPIESLNVFNAMRDVVDTYPDMPAYHIIAVTLGQAGHLEELFELMQTLRKGPEKNGKYLLMVNQGRLIPDIVVYNAALNACVPHRHWRVALWILDQIYKEKDVKPNSASYGLVIEVMVKAGKFDLAWKILGKMELGGFHPNSLTYKALVEGLGQVGKAGLAIQMVEHMEERGIVAVPGVYYALACTLCRCGNWQDALLQVDRIGTLSGRPLVETYTGLIKACKESGRWGDAISVFEHMREVCAPNIGTYNIMISVYGVNSMYDEAKNLYNQIKTGRISPPQLYRGDPRLSPDVFTYDAVLGACTNSEKWEDLEVIFRQMLLQGYQLNSKRHTWIVQAISEAGEDKLLAAMFYHLRSLSAASPELYVLMIKSCLTGGERDKAFSLLEEMATRNMGISSSDFERFQTVGCLLSEEDRLIFMNKVESLNSTSHFNFTKERRFTSLHRGSSAFKQLASSPMNSHYDNREAMSRNESSDKSLQNISTSLAFGSHQDKSFEAALSPANLEVTKNWPSDDSQSTLTSAHIPGWEFLWKRSIHKKLSSSQFHLLSQLA